VTSSVESETGLKESKIQLVLANFTYYLTSDLSWISDLSAFVKAPAGVRPSLLSSSIF
jgi:autophagy-related protein 2